MKKKKILYVSPNGYLGGAERFVLTAAGLHHKNSNFDVAILFYSDGEAVKEAKSLGITTYILKSRFKLSHPLALLKALKEMRKITEHFAADILHLTMPYAHITMSLATIGLNLKKVWFQHGPVGGHLDRIGSLFRSDVIIYNSQYILERHTSSSFLSNVSHSEHILKLGVSECEKRNPLFSTGVIRIGAAGRICSWKGFHNVLLAIAELKKESPLKPFSFKIAGSPKNPGDMAYLIELKKIVFENHLINEVQFLGHVDDISTFYKEIDVFVHCSTIPEPFGLVVAEAMAHGCGVIGSNEGGVRDILKDRQTGWTFSSTRETAIPELKSRLRDLLNINETWASQEFIDFSKAGQIFVKENYSIVSMVDKLEEIYLQIAVCGV